MRKKDLPSKENQRLIKEGSRVMVIDGSYMTKSGEEDNNTVLTLDDDGQPIGHSTDIFRVLAINSPFPTKYYGSDSLGIHNNCSIKNERTGEIWYCSHINIRNIEDKYTMYENYNKN